LRPLPAPELPWVPTAFSSKPTPTRHPPNRMGPTCFPSHYSKDCWKNWSFCAKPSWPFPHSAEPGLFTWSTRLSWRKTVHSGKRWLSTMRWIFPEPHRVQWEIGFTSREPHAGSLFRACFCGVPGRHGGTLLEAGGLKVWEAKESCCLPLCVIHRCHRG